MLHYATIEATTLELLKRVQQVEEFRNLRLVGGTALALQIGHRRSVDLDFFGIHNLDDISFSKTLESFGKVIQLKKSESINIYSINDIKVDFVNYHYPWIENIVQFDNISLAGKKDIAAMKLAAITGRGSKKDFIDLFFLLKEFSLQELLDFYSLKFSDGSTFLVLKSLNYFSDAQLDPQPYMLENVSWEKVKDYISNEVENYIKRL